MERRNIVVDQGKNLLELLAEMGERMESAWVFFDKSIVDYLRTIAKDSFNDGGVYIYLACHSSEEVSPTKIMVRARNSSESEWYELISCDASDIFFKFPANDPRWIFFFTMGK